ncbi:unnamed protein product [Dicrocoelium dendriticum]|nr:unnamed protein product [Dicrocoelium dendriticum]
MVRITEELIRKRAEHNEGEVFSLEELSLHQQNLERIELLDKLCRDLKILYLQNNLISKIENVSRLKKLEYLNLALNNIERIENLEGCESLKKLDLTVNFVGDLISIECLVDLYALEEIYLTGNPCADYPHYRHYVIATLPQLQKLDGTDISKSERIVALQNLEQIRPAIRECQEKHFRKRMNEKNEAANRRKKLQDKLANCDGELDSTVKEFWDEKVPFTPESRVETHEYMQMQEEAKTKYKEREKPKRMAPRLFADDGRPLNVNEPKISFKLTEGQVEGQDAFILDVSVYRHMETTLLDCDVQPNYVRVSLKKKVLQLALPEEVQPDRSEAKRSQTTGHLVITMPKVTQLLRAACTRTQMDSPRAHRNAVQRNMRAGDSAECPGKQPSKLLLDDECNTGVRVDWKSIVSPKNKESGSTNHETGVLRRNPMLVRSRSNSPDFVDCPDVPPLV